MESYDYQYVWRLFGADPNWLTWIIGFVILTYACCIFGVVFGKMGRSPFWGFIFLLPFFGTIALYFTAFTKWPQERTKSP